MHVLSFAIATFKIDHKMIIWSAHYIHHGTQLELMSSVIKSPLSSILHPESVLAEYNQACDDFNQTRINKIR